MFIVYLFNENIPLITDCKSYPSPKAKSCSFAINLTWFPNRSKINLIKAEIWR